MARKRPSSGSDEPDGGAWESLEEDGDSATAPAAGLFRLQNGTAHGQVAKRPRTGELRSGWIQSIELVDFMCHRHLLVRLSKNINFVTGNNGSGKSAILTAITVALGGRASTTQRALSLASLVREGAETAIVRVVLSNGDGSNAFRPERYGEAVVIERRFGRSPSTNKYLTYSAHRRLVSDKRDEISQICDHFAIQVDNPLSVLTQETAKRFLASAKPKELYEFFLKATQLEQLAYDYTFAKERIEVASERIEAIKAAWAPQEEAIKDLERKFSDVSRQKDLRRKVHSTKAQMAWSLVGEKEAELEDLKGALAKKQDRIDACNLERARILDRAAKIQDEVAALQKEASSFGSQLAPIQTEYSSISRRASSLKLDLGRLNAQIKETNMAFKEEKDNLERLEKQIEEELRRTNGEHEASLSRTMKRSENELLKLTDELAKARAQDSKLRSARSEANARAAKARELLEDTSNKLGDRRSNLESLKRAKGNRLKLFGERLPDLLREIGHNAEAFHRQPVGPIGMYVELKDKRWALPIEAIIGKELDAFIVKDQHDHDLLLSLLRKFGLRSPICMLASDAPLDISGGQPGKGFVTALRTLEVKHALVLKALIIQTNLEKAVFMETRDEAKGVLRRRERNVESSFTPTDRVFVTSSSHSSSALYSAGRIRLIQSDEHHLEELEGTVKRLASDRETLLRDVSRLENESMQVQSEYAKNESLAQSLEKQIAKVKGVLLELDNELTGIASLSFQTCEDERKHCQETMDTLRSQFVALGIQKQDLESQIDSLNGELESNLKSQDVIKAESDAVLEKLCETNQFRSRSDKELGSLESKKDYEVTEAQVIEKKMEMLDAEVKAMIVDSTRIGPRVEATKPYAELNRDLLKSQAILDELARTQPDPESIAHQLSQARESLERSKDVIRQEESLISKMKVTLKKREHLWKIWRASIAKRSTIEFIMMLSARDFQGSLYYDFQASELTIRVKPKAQVASDLQFKSKAADAQSETDSTTSTERDVRQLSGGEKSYSTSCFLFSLWSSIASPIRCLDEFDVFMDQVNRSFVIQELVKNAKSSGVQYILITPNAIWDCVKYEPDMKIIRLHDPDRRQAVID